MSSAPDITYPCKVCRTYVQENEDAVLCETCLNWVHRRCDVSVTDEIFHKLTRNENMSFICSACRTLGDALMNFNLVSLINKKILYYIIF